MTDTPITPAPAPAAAPAAGAALPEHIAALDPAAREVALASLAKAGRPVPAAVPAPTPASTPPASPTNPAPDLTRVTGNDIGQGDALRAWQRMDKTDTARAERFRQAFVADHGVDPDIAAGTAEQRAFQIPPTPEGYDLKLDQSLVSDDPAAQAEYREGFGKLAHALELPAPVAQVLANEIVEAAARFEASSPEAKAEYFHGKGGIGHAVKTEVAQMLGYPDWERGKAAFQDALKPVFAKMSTDDIAGMIEAGVFNDARVLMRLVRHGEMLHARHPTPTP